MSFINRRGGHGTLPHTCLTVVVVVCCLLLLMMLIGVFLARVALRRPFHQHQRPLHQHQRPFRQHQHQRPFHQHQRPFQDLFMGVKGQGEHAKSLDAELIDVIRPLHPPESSLTGGLPLFDMLKHFWLFGVAPQAVLSIYRSEF